MSDDFEACPECDSLLEHSGRCLKCERFEREQSRGLLLFALVGAAVFFGGVVLAFGLLAYLQ